MSAPPSILDLEFGDFTRGRESAGLTRPGDFEPVEAPPTGTDRRRAVIKRVEGYVCRDRQDSYADAEENFQRIAELASVVLARKLIAPLDRLDVALFSACIKLGRLAHNPRHLDSLDDLAGYAVCAAGIVGQERGE